MATIEERVELLRRRLIESQHDAVSLERSVTDLEKSWTALEATAGLADGAGKVLRALGELKQAEVSKQVEDLVTKALRTVFGREDYRFAFTWEVSRGQASAIPTLWSVFAGNECCEEDILDGHGGGVVDVISFVLRFVVARFTTPPLLPLLVLDEPFRHVDQKHADGIGRLLTLLTERTGWRILMVTHSEELAERADHVYEAVRGSDGRTTLCARGRVE